MKFDTYIPCDKLKPFVKSLVISESVEERTYKVLPGTSLVIGFQYAGKLLQVNEEKEIVLSSSGITGLGDRYKLFKNVRNTGSVLIYFNEAGAATFFKQPLHELFRESLSLDNFMLRSELLLLEEQLCEATTDKIRIDIVERFLISKIKYVEPDQLVLAALSLIHKSKGAIKIKELLTQLHISQSPFEKKFRQAVGATPKKFASIVRMKNLLQQYDLVNSLTNLGYEAGFYDQAHFIKEFKNFTGDTPANYFSSADK